MTPCVGSPAGTITQTTRVGSSWPTSSSSDAAVPFPERS